MKKKFLFVIGAIAFLALNVLAFSATSFLAYAVEPVTHGNCYQHTTVCAPYGGYHLNCTSQHSNTYCTQTYAQCHACSTEPTTVDPNDHSPFPVSAIEQEYKGHDKAPAGPVGSDQKHP